MEEHVKGKVAYSDYLPSGTVVDILELRFETFSFPRKYVMVVTGKDGHATPIVIEQ